MPLPLSPLAKKRLAYKPEMPLVLKNIQNITINSKTITAKSSKVKTDPKIKSFFKKSFGQPLVSLTKSSKKAKSSKNKDKNKKQLSKKPLKVGVVFSGGQAPGGHNVIAGLFDSIKQLHPKSELLGFLNGPSGIVDGKYKPITKQALESYRNQGGFDLIGSGRTKIETEEQLKASLKTVQKLKLDGLVVIGGDDSNTNAAVMAEYFLTKGAKTKVIGVPKTIDGDLRGEHIETSFGFDTATKVYSEMIGNIAKDALSAKKYYHFIKLMGRSASHVTLECALKTQVNFVFIAEEVLAQKLSLSQLANELGQKIEKRSQKGKNYGVVLIPEGLIEFIPEVKNLIKELNNLLAGSSKQTKNKNKNENKNNKIAKEAQNKAEQVSQQLSASSRRCFNLLPTLIKEQLLFDRDPHGNVQVSKIETEKLLMELVAEKLKGKSSGKNKKVKFKAQPHFFGYEGRAGLPTNFDADYCYSLGFTAVALIKAELTGYMAGLKGLSQKASNWQPIGVPLTSMMKMEMRKGKEKPVIQKALVDLKGKDFKRFQKERRKWEESDVYLCPGPYQF